MILFLNKCDLLQAKLMRGVRIRDQVPSYSDRKNDLPTATRCTSSELVCVCMGIDRGM
jgi:guanine nucleotide-binding protein subunit alpha